MYPLTVGKWVCNHIANHAGIAIISHPLNHHFYRWYKPSKMVGLLLLYPHYGRYIYHVDLLSGSTKSFGCRLALGFRLAEGLRTRVELELYHDYMFNITLSISIIDIS